MRAYWCFGNSLLSVTLCLLFLILMFVFLSLLIAVLIYSFFFFFQAEDGIRDYKVTGVQTCALPISYPTASIAMIKPPTSAIRSGAVENPTKASVANLIILRNGYLLLPARLGSRS